MSGIQGIGGIPDPAPQRSTGNVRDRRRDDEVNGAQSQDDVLISSEAQAAARLAALIGAAKSEADVRPERVEQAREAIERGDYKRPDVVEELARRISKLLP